MLNITQQFQKNTLPKTESGILEFLESFGRLSDDSDEELFLDLAKNESEKIRTLALKNLAKLEKVSLLSFFFGVFQNDSSTSVKREAVSAMGRMRNRNTIPYLLTALKSDDPKITLQAMRGLLVFKNDKEILSQLYRLKNHQNEMIREVIEKEINFLEPESEQNHTKSPDFMKNVAVNGDVLETLKHIPNQSIHLTFTSPPYYNARDYSIYLSYEVYLEFLRKVFEETHRITKEGRFLVINTSPVIMPRVSRSHSSKRYPIPFDLNSIVTKMGWEFIDDIVWEKPEACVKNRNGGFQQHRKPLGYKPNARTEYVMVYRKKTDKLIDWNMRQYPYHTTQKSKVQESFETSNLWKIDPSFDKTHSAVFPIELCRRVVKFYSFVGDLIFDPFAGSGTLGQAAYELQRFFFLTEIDKGYHGRIKERLSNKNIFDDTEKSPSFVAFNEFVKIVKKQI